MIDADEAHRGQGCYSTGEESPMRKRNIIIAIVTAASLAAAPAADAFARGGGGGGGHGGMGGGMGGGGRGIGGGMGVGGGMGGARGMSGGMGGGGMSHMSFARPPGFAGATRTASGPRSFAFTGNRVAFANHFPFHDRHFFIRHHRFFFAGAPFAYAYYDDGCYQRVWTRWGWHWINVCTY